MRNRNAAFLLLNFAAVFALFVAGLAWIATNDVAYIFFGAAALALLALAMLSVRCPNCGRFVWLNKFTALAGLRSPRRCSNCGIDLGRT